MKILVVLFIVSCLGATVISRTQLMMGTLVSIKVEQKYKNHISKSFSIITDVENSLSSFKNTSIISKLNKNKKVKLDALTYEALKLSKKYYIKSDAYFNIAIGTITKDLYKFGTDESIPNSNELNDAKIDFNGLVFDEYSATLRDGIKLDLGGMGKGFAVDKVSSYLLSNSVNEAIVSASGDIRCLSVCTINVQNPFNDSMMLSFKTKKANLGISTSGNYNRYVKDKSNNHLINPRTKLSAQNFASITLVGDMKSSALDAYATAVSVMPKKEAYRFLDNLEVGYIVIEVDGKSVVKNSIFFDLVLNVK